MHILKVAQTYYPYVDEGGRPTKVRAITKRLVLRGHSVMVLTANHDRRGGHSDEDWTPDQDGADVIYLPSHIHFRTVTLNLGMLPFCLKSLRKFDLVHVYGIYDLLGITIAYFCRQWGIPYVVEPMGMFQPIVRSIGLKKLYHCLWGRKLVSGASRILATSNQERLELLAGDVPDSKIIVRRNGIEKPEYIPRCGTFRQHWKIPPAAQMVLFLGRIVAKKSLDLLLRAFALLRSNNDSAVSLVLVLAGPEERDGYRRQLDILSEQLGVSQRIIYTGPIYGDDKWAAYREADLFVLPSENENFGNTVAESVACETPVVITDRCGIAPFIGDRVGLVVPHGVEPVYGAIRRLLTDRVLYRGFVGNCPAVAQELSWDQPIELLEKIYRQIMVER